MSQHDYNLANAAGAAFRTDLNLALAAILSNNSGAAEPSSTSAYMIWADTTAGLIKMRNAADTGWVSLGAIDGFIASQAAVDAGTVADKFVTPLTLENTVVPNATAAVTATKVGVLNVKVIDIGDWDMDSTQTVYITHGLSLSKIRSIAAVVRNDLDTAIYSLNAIVSPTLQIQAAIGGTTATEVLLTRLTSGVFDSLNFDSTSYNRGWVTIWYID